jgi:DNA repair protein RadC
MEGFIMVNLSILNLKVVKEKEVNYDWADKKINSPEKVAEVAINVLGLHEQAEESFYIFTLDTKNKINGIFEVSKGSLNSSIVHPREVFKRALLQNANSIILLHNHPSSDPTPSKEDIDITNRLIEAGDLLGIRVLDHLVVGDQSNYISFKEKTLM